VLSQGREERVDLVGSHQVRETFPSPPCIATSGDEAYLTRQCRGLQWSHQPAPLPPTNKTVSTSTPRPTTPTCMMNTRTSVHRTPWTSDAARCQVHCPSRSSTLSETTEGGASNQKKKTTSREDQQCVAGDISDLYTNDTGSHRVGFEGRGGTCRSTTNWSMVASQQIRS
jgi:hypothetical protein